MVHCAAQRTAFRQIADLDELKWTRELNVGELFGSVIW